jgi:NitT/TauT family transport system substrate-binding protein
VTRSPDVKSIKDFGPNDRIAVPTVKVSSQAIMLAMALEQAYGEGAHTKLDVQTVQLGHPEAMQAIGNPNHEITSHYSAPPYQEQELKAAGVHAVLNSSDTMGGPVTNAIVFATAKVHDANPKAIQAFIAALDEANAFIASNKRDAAEIYLAATKEKFTPDEIVAMLNEPNVVFSSTPVGTMKLASFMAKVGLIKDNPESWKDLFFSTIHHRPGS